MKLSGINIIEHPAIAADEAWIIRHEDAPQVPPDLRGQLQLPCILTGSAILAKHTLALLEAVCLVPAPSRKRSSTKKQRHGR